MLFRPDSERLSNREYYLELGVFATLSSLLIEVGERLMQPRGRLQEYFVTGAAFVLGMLLAEIGIGWLRRPRGGTSDAGGR
jgi:hypothetical protein